MPTMTLNYDDFVVSLLPGGEPNVTANLVMEVDYEWEPYCPGNWHDEPPSGGCPDGWEIKVTSAECFDKDGNTTTRDLAEIQKMVSNCSEINDWVGNQLQEKHEEPERDD